MNFLANIGQHTIAKVTSIGAAFILLLQSIFLKPSAAGFKLFVYQIYRIGVLSLSIIGVSGLFIGLVLGLQGYSILKEMGSESILGTFVALTLLRELAPVVAALLFAGRAGSAITSEIGLMKAKEELSSMEMIGVDPIRQIIAPRLWAGLVSLPMLTIIFASIGILGGKFIGVDFLGVDSGSYWGVMRESVNFSHDVVNGLIKSIVFALLCVWISVYQGYNCDPTSEGISTATTNTVVYSSLAILGFDLILTAVMFGGF